MIIGFAGNGRRPAMTGASLPPETDRHGRRLLLLFPALLLLALFLVSVGQMVLLSLEDGGQFSLRHYREFFARPDYVETYLRTVRVSILVSLASILVGYPIAYGIWRHRGSRNLLMVLVILPWLVSVVCWKLACWSSAGDLASTPTAVLPSWPSCRPTATPGLIWGCGRSLSSSPKAWARSWAGRCAICSFCSSAYPPASATASSFCFRRSVW